jgi:hypothetical protein
LENYTITQFPNYSIQNGLLAGIVGWNTVLSSYETLPPVDNL